MLIPEKTDDNPTKDKLSDIFQDKWRTELLPTPQIDKGSAGVELSRDALNQLWVIPFELFQNIIYLNGEMTVQTSPLVIRSVSPISPLSSVKLFIGRLTNTQYFTRYGTVLCSCR